MRNRVAPVIALLLVSLILSAGCSKPVPTPTSTAKPATTSPAAAPAPPVPAPAAPTTPVPATAKPATTAPSPTAAPLKLKFAMSALPTHIRSKTMQYWMDQVTKATGGRIVWEVYWNESLFSAGVAFDSLSQGTADVSYVVGSYHSGKTPQLAIFNAPWAFNHKTWIKAEEEARPIVDTVFEKNNIKFLWGNRPSDNLFATRKDFIRGTQDFKGMKVRSSGGLMDKAYATWGAATVTLPVGDIYSALQKGVADSTQISFDTYGALRLLEVVPYITLWQNVANFQHVSMNLSSWKKLSKEDQDIFISAGRQAMEFAEQSESTNDPAVIKQYEAAGAKVYNMPAPDIASIKASVAGLWDEAAKGSNEAAKLTELMRKYTGG